MSKHTETAWNIHPSSKDDTPMHVVPEDGSPCFNALNLWLASGEKIIGTISFMTGESGFPSVNTEQECRANLNHIVHCVNTYPQLVEALRQAKTLLKLLTVRQVVEAGYEECSAAGLNPWCINEGKATGDERIDTYRFESALKLAEEGESHVL